MRGGKNRNPGRFLRETGKMDKGKRKEKAPVPELSREKDENKK